VYILSAVLLGRGEGCGQKKTAREFREETKHKYGFNQRVYFQFNVQYGLEQVGFEEWKELDRAKIATNRVLD
jgi:hypothetical protein